MRRETLMGLATVPFLLVISGSAFSFGTRQKIFKRDGGKCADCEKTFADGWLVDASHYDHDRSKATYDSAENGRIQCLDDHLSYHQQLGDRNGVYLIQKRIKESRGGRTRKWIEEHS